MHLLSLLVTAVFTCSVHSVKFNTDIDGCMAQVEGILGGESDAKTDDVRAIQKVVKDASDAEKSMVLNKYMGAACAPLKNCFVCPLEMA